LAGARLTSTGPAAVCGSAPARSILLFLRGRVVHHGPMIRVEGLTKRYGPTLAVDDLTFAVEPGIVTGFLGPNGSGKSTTMRMILGLDRPSAGTATIDGKPYAALDRPLHTVGALLDAKWVHPNRSARAHLQWMAAAGGIDGRRVDEVLELVGLSSQAKKKAGG